MLSVSVNHLSVPPKETGLLRWVNSDSKSVNVSARCVRIQKKTLKCEKL